MVVHVQGGIGLPEGGAGEPQAPGLQSVAEWGEEFLCVTQCFCQGVQKPGGIGAFRHGEQGDGPDMHRHLAGFGQEEHLVQ